MSQFQLQVTNKRDQCCRLNFPERTGFDDKYGRNDLISLYERNLGASCNWPSKITILRLITIFRAPKRTGLKDNLGILNKNIIASSSEQSCPDGSNKHHNICFQWKRRKIIWILLNTPFYLELSWPTAITHISSLHDHQNHSYLEL